MASEPRLIDADIRPETSREYEFAAVATASVDGPDGELRLERRYEALPRHNDAVAPTAVDSNDEMVDSPNEIHVHTRFYDEEGYFLDGHDSWTPEDRSVLGNESAFLALCRNHHRDDAEPAYERALRERDD